MVSRRRLLLGSAAALGAVGIGVAGSANAAVLRSAAPARLGAAVFGMPLPDGTTVPVTYLSRAAWGADESLRFSGGVEIWPAECYPAQALTVHHSGFMQPNPDQAAKVRAIYHSHAVVQGWGDIGYHLLIDDAGTVYEGRWNGTDGLPVFGPDGTSGSPLVNTGGHALSYNTGNIGVCLIGDFTAGTPTAATQTALVNVLAGLARICAIDPIGLVSYVNPVNGATRSVRGVSGHRDWNATACPGNAFYPVLEDIRVRTAALLPPPQRVRTDSSEQLPSEPRTPPPTQPSAPSTTGAGGRTRP
jgi:uncharacterized protein with LGFP repeats